VGLLVAFNILTKISVEAALKYHKGPLSVCDLGNQRYRGDYEPQSYQTVAEYYSQEHRAQYIAFDLNSEMGAVPLDLNLPVAEQGHSYQYDLVVNNGTSEHLINQYQVFKNMHDLCVFDGIMLNVVPFSPWINHGFFNYNPIFFRDLILANNYECLFFAICDRYAGGWANIPQEELFNEDNPSYLMGKIAKANTLKSFTDMKWYAPDGHKPMDRSNLRLNQLFIAVAYKKLRGDQKFCPPIQGKYKGDIADKEIRERYA